MSQHTSAARAGVTALITALSVTVPVAASQACATRAHASSVSAATTRSAPYAQTLLIFGSVRPDGGPDVTRKQFQRFVDEVVTPRFPDGLTVNEGRGQWRDQHGVIEREKSYELYLLYPVAQGAEKSMAIDEIRELYKQRFAQESVARIDEPAQVDF